MTDLARAGHGRVFNIPGGVPFVDALARGLLDQAGRDPLALAAATVLLPTRRACRALTDAFLRVTDGRALLLPRLVALAEIDSEPDPLAGSDLEGAPAPLERLLTLARLVLGAGPAFAATVDQALRLARSLADLIDEIETERVDAERLSELVPEEYAEHWQKTLAFLRIVTAAWPRILEDAGQVDPARRRVLALNARAEAWSARPPTSLVAAAGFASADPALATLIDIVARLPRGMAVLPGLDTDLDDESWGAIEPTHPQFGLKRLIEALGVPRDRVAPWPAAVRDESAAARVRLLSDTLRPAETTEQWRDAEPVPADALAGLTRLDCDTVGEEADAIALAMREVLEEPGRTAALVTPDRDLARRVAAALGRWGVQVDDSAGRPLSATPVGVWLRLVAEATVGGFAPRDLLSLLKHPLAACGQPPADLRQRVRALERAILRGPRPAPGLAGLALSLQSAPAARFEGGAAERDRLVAWMADLADRLRPLADLVQAGGGPLADLVEAHGRAAEALAETPDMPGPLILWRGQDGEAAADLLAQLADSPGFGLPDLPADRYPATLDLLMQHVPVRPLYGAHPRLAIWGLIEARLQRADLMILGGLNEGTWPPLPGDEPWMSRPMRVRFGLTPPEARIGAAAHDFAQAAAARHVLLTRARRVEGAPTVPARFLSRLDTRLAASGASLPRAEAGRLRAWAAALDEPSSSTPAMAPAPCPPVAARPRRLPVTAIETWMRDPYALYARVILGLRALDPIDADPGAAERGEFIHRALDRFVRDHPGLLPPDALEQLEKAGRAAFGAALDHPAIAAFWWPRFQRAASWFINFERDRRGNGILPLATELTGTLDFRAPAGPFTLTAKADRIDRLPTGQIAIIDYKTGQAPSRVEIALGLSPQLPLEALIAEAGGFPDMPRRVAELAFIRLTGGDPPGERIDADPGGLPQLVAEARGGLERLIAEYDRPETPYRARPRPDFARAGDYDHLERVDAWSVGSSEP